MTTKHKTTPKTGCGCAANKKPVKKSIRIIGLFGKTEKAVICKHCGSPMKWEDTSEDTKYYECPDCGEMCTVRGNKINWQSDY
jgi:predicted RNA-binding Zn-ribbon protein involved in translation (DUF1610 family)